MEPPVVERRSLLAELEYFPRVRQSGESKIVATDAVGFCGEVEVHLHLLSGSGV